MSHQPEMLVQGDFERFFSAALKSFPVSLLPAESAVHVNTRHFSMIKLHYLVPYYN